MLAEAVSNELQGCEEEQAVDPGLLAALCRDRSLGHRASGKIRNPFKALMAHRTSCLECSYTEAVRHLPSEHVTLNVPLLVRQTVGCLRSRQLIVDSQSSCRLEDCLREYTKLELLDEFRCRRCALLSTRSRISSQITRIRGSAAEQQQPLNASKKKRIKELQRNVNRLDAILASNPESVPDDVKLDRPPPSPASKQTMFARAPKVLTIHLSRSSHYSPISGQAIKNGCQVLFDDSLDLAPFSTSGQLSVSPYSPISSSSSPSSSQSSTTSSSFTAAASPNGNGTTSPRAEKSNRSYTLKSVVVHYGSHSWGHYVAYRRIGDRWWKISDEHVGETSREEVLGANPFLLFYEMENDDGGTDDGGDEKGEQRRGRRLRPAVWTGARVVQRLVGVGSRRDGEGVSNGEASLSPDGIANGPVDGVGR
jgi:ubiquitin carboxyl-terminal hydrolase 1